MSIVLSILIDEVFSALLFARYCWGTRPGRSVRGTGFVGAKQRVRTVYKAFGKWCGLGSSEPAQRRRPFHSRPVAHCHMDPIANTG